MAAMYCFGLPKENFEKVQKSKFSKKNFAQISFRNRTYAKFSKEYIAKKVGVSIPTVRSYTEAGFPKKFYKDFVEKKGYIFYWEYQKSL